MAERDEPTNPAPSSPKRSDVCAVRPWTGAVREGDAIVITMTEVQVMYLQGVGCGGPLVTTTHS